MESDTNLIKPKELIELTLDSFDEFIIEEKCEPLEAASMVISNVAKAMIQSNLNKVLVLRCLLELAKEIGNSLLMDRITNLIKNTTRQLDNGDTILVNRLLKEAMEKRNSDIKFGGESS